uniref:Uncharacterized protein n=1 Tax=Anguilla anguilla TaxID=7936 RepID=A0A0E9U537_ANGAN
MQWTFYCNSFLRKPVSCIFFIFISQCDVDLLFFLIQTSQHIFL